ncbi:hypothetical protein ABW20_dc0106208 [Dactylellina cionopaga]|nr:hypothetical protein ABW20_dc0106208 [Dactylellina cionopaga]
MNFHSYGRSLKLAVSRYPQKGSHHVRRISSNNDGAIYKTKSRRSYKPPSGTSRFEHPYKLRAETDHSENEFISKDDLDFVWSAKSANILGDIRKRIYSEDSILKTNAYDVLATFSRKQRQEKQRQEKVPDDIYLKIPGPSSDRHQATSLARNRSGELKKNSFVGKRDPARAANHKQLFEAIDISFKSGPPDWPIRFYNAACTTAYGAIDNRVRAACISYLVKTYVLGDKLDSIIPLYPEIQNSWLPTEQRELDAIEYFKAIFGALRIRPASSATAVNQVLETFRLASANFDRQFTHLYTFSFKEAITPHLLLFLSSHVPLHKSLDVVTAQINYIRDTRSGDRLIPALFGNLNKALISSQNLRLTDLDGLKVTTFYNTQSEILQAISQIPRSPAADKELAKVMLQQAITWEEILEAKRLILDSSITNKRGNQDGNNQLEIIKLQSQLMRSLYHLSQLAKPGSIRSKHASELLSAFLSLLDLRGSAGDKGTSIGVGTAMYARAGLFTAVERLLDTVESHKKDVRIPLSHLRETITGLNSAVKTKSPYRKDARGRAGVMAMRLFRLHVRQVRKSKGQRLPERIHQGLVRDLIPLLRFCGHSVGIREVWETITTADFPFEKINTSTVEVILDGLIRTEDIFFAKKVLETVESNEGSKVTASMLQPFLVADAKFILNDIVRLGIDNGISWDSLAHLYQLRAFESNSTKMDESQVRRVQEWVGAIADCANEVVRERQGSIAGKSLEQLEQAFSQEVEL